MIPWSCMATLSQVTANRLNSQSSTGPRSVEGKAATRFNAMKLGLDAQSMVIPGEHPTQLPDLADSFFDEPCPQGALEPLLVQTLVRSEWFRRRYMRIEAQL